MTWFNVVLPVLTLMLGYAGTLLTESRRDARQRIRDAEARIASRAQATVDRREQFELASLKDAYASLTRLARVTMRFHMVDLEVARSTNSPYGSHRTDDIPGVREIEDEALLANQECDALIQLILDDGIRKIADDAQTRLNSIALGQKTESEAEFAVRQAMAATRTAQLTVASRIRDLYVAEPLSRP